ncbi:MAG: prepilin-type N-terminal cleavage/methylation domain-containing protein [Eubacteriales bacterium]|nr:prepilin-type N-terminal cleavage/methylation domain-containing protein [Eubacteriales bacterium]
MRKSINYFYGSKKAFTVVELVIVIAVIAILAAVLIPAISNVVEKARITSDQAAVKEMNTALVADEKLNGPCANYSEAVEVLGAAGLDAAHFTALSKGYEIYFDANINRCLLIKITTDEATGMKSYSVVYPEEYVDQVNYYLQGDTSYEYLQGLASLKGQLANDDSWKKSYTPSASVETKSQDGITYYDITSLKESIASSSETSFGTYTGNFLKSGSYTTEDGSIVEYSHTYNTVVVVGTGNQLTSFREFVSTSNNAGAGVYLTLSKDLDLNGAEWAPIEKYSGSFDGSKTDGGTYKISNFAMSDFTAAVATYESTTTGGSYFYYGLFQVFDGKYLGNITLEGVNINTPGVSVETANAKTGHVTAAVAGLIDNAAGYDMVIENITVASGTIKGLQRTGGLFGNIGTLARSSNLTGGSITIRNCKNYADVSTVGSVSNAHATIGGIAAITYKTGTCPVNFIDCYNYGSVSGGCYTAGILGFNNAGTEVNFVNCKNYGNITSTFKTTTFATSGILCAAGISTDRNMSAMSFTDCYNEGKITADATNSNNRTGTPVYCTAIYLGEIVSSNKATLTNCTAADSVTLTYKDPDSKVTTLIGADNTGAVLVPTKVG